MAYNEQRRKSGFRTFGKGKSQKANSKSFEKPKENEIQDPESEEP
jgi:hypothetical protein